jgi:hypothetical protein
MPYVKTALLVGAAAIVLSVIGRYFLGGHRVPAGQPPLAELTRASIDSLKSEFNRTPDQVRIVLLLSPT